MERPGALGEWTDRPRRIPDADVTRARLDHREAFVLTRLDGQASISDVCEMSGLGTEETVRVLERLVEAELITIEKALRAERRPPRRDRALEAGWSAAAQGQPVRTEAKVKAPAGPPAPAGVSADDLRVLRAYGRLGFVPAEPVVKPGGADPRYGDFVFDQRELLERCDLTVDQRREILFRYHNRDRMDHYELLGCEPTADRKAIRSAFFEFSKRWHPDAWFGKDLGRFAERMQAVYKLASEIHEALRSDQRLRETYYRVVKARDEAFQAKRAAERAAAEAERREREAREAERRKKELEERLRERARLRRERGLANPMVDRIKKAEHYYTEGMAQYDNGNFLAAANSLKLAMTFDPKNEQYKQAYTKVDGLAKQTRAKQLWKRGYMEESIGRTREAILSYLQAVECYPRPDYLGHVAELMWQNELDLHRAAELARLATQKDPQNVDYLLTLGRIYKTTNQTKRALSVFERVLKLDSGNEIAKKAVKALKRL